MNEYAPYAFLKNLRFYAENLNIQVSPCMVLFACERIPAIGASAAVFAKLLF
jgi:hypothetical protein